uniref:Chromatin-remodeling ATPase INO80 n=1 Tax=Culicoides sonorensis TaxID=179676 RepID=A0A336MTU9_CULSO
MSNENSSTISMDTDENSDPNIVPMLNKKEQKEADKIEFITKEEEARQKRLDYLLEQTEVYSHFVATHINPQLTETANAGPSAEPPAKTKTKKGGKAPKKPVIFESTPSYIKFGEMRDYQLRGLNWMISLYQNGLNGILADEMGLGKTLQTISMLGYLKNVRKSNGHSIVIAPKSTIQNWMNELKRWCPSLRAVCVIGHKDERKAHIRKNVLPGKWDVLVTSYDMVLLEKYAFSKFIWQYLIIDEAHRIKNEQTQLAKIVRTFKSSNRLLLTGTPLQNNLHELWALLNFLLPDVFNSSDDFDEWFSTDKCLGDKTLVERLHVVMKPFLLRRLKSDVEKQLLPKKEVKLYVGMSKLQHDYYKKVLLKDIDVLNNSGQFSKKRMGMILTALRQSCDHPYLFDGAEPGPPYTTDQHLVNNSGKMIVLDKLLPKLKEQGSRVLIFAQFIGTLNILEDYCMWRNYDYCRLDGSTSDKIRAESIEEFNAPDSKKFIFMISTRAGGLGINLATADVVILYGSDWNPQVDIQAIDRAHRIGQKKQVRVFRFITENTIEERIAEIADIKLRLDNIVIQEGRIVENQKKPSGKELLRIIRLAAQNLQVSEITDEDIDVLLERCEQKTEELTKKYDKMGESALRKFAIDNDVEQFSLFNFEGEDYRAKRKELEKENEDIDLPRRKRFKVSVQQPPPVPPNQLTLQEFRFYPKGLKEIFDKETYYFRKQLGYEAQLSQYLDDPEEERLAEQEKIDNATPLTEAEMIEKDYLFSQGFNNWTKTDFKQFLKGLKTYLKDDYAKLSKLIQTKTETEVETYSKVFWMRYNEIEHFEQRSFDRIINEIYQAQKKLQVAKTEKESTPKQMNNLMSELEYL